MSTSTSQLLEEKAITALLAQYDACMVDDIEVNHSLIEISTMAGEDPSDEDSARVFKNILLLATGVFYRDRPLDETGAPIESLDARTQKKLRTQLKAAFV
jgi:hypothetical protein